MASMCGRLRSPAGLPPAGLRVLAAAFVVASCATAPGAPNLGTLYASVADEQLRNPVVAIPGLLGSRLVDSASGTVVWGGESALSVDPSDPEKLRLAALPLIVEGQALRDARDDVRTDGVVRRAHLDLLGFQLNLDIYAGLVSALIAGGYDFRETRAEEIAEREVNLDAFEFPFDWRRDVVEAAQGLDAFLRRKRDQVAAERLRVLGDAGPPVRFDIVSHSMGALVARYYLMFGAADLPADGSTPPVTWAGAELVDTAVMIAPPFSGSVTAVDNLIDGRQFGPFQPFYPAAMLGTYPGLYQLMPRDRHQRVSAAEPPPLGSLYDVETWEAEGWGLLDPGAAELLAQMLPDEPDPAQRRARARAHVAAALARAEQLDRAIDQPNVPPAGLELFLVVGGGFETPAHLVWNRADHEMRVTQLEEGDGVVLRASSFADLRQSGGVAPAGRNSPHAYRSTLLLPDEHVGITREPGLRRQSALLAAGGRTGLGPASAAHQRRKGAGRSGGGDAARRRQGRLSAPRGVDPRRLIRSGGGRRVELFTRRWTAHARPRPRISRRSPRARRRWHCRAAPG